MALIVTGTQKPSGIGDLQCAMPVIRQSTLKDFVNCRRYALYRHVLGLSPKTTRRSVSADTGTFWHLGMSQACQSTGGTDKARLAMIDLRDRLVADMAQALEEDLTGEVMKQVKDLTMACDKAIAMLRIFWHKYPLRDDIEIVATEDTLLLKLPVLDDLWVQVKPDLIVRDTHGNLWIEDHKSTGVPPSEVMVGKPWNFQTTLYAAAVATKYAQPVTGVIFNIMQTPGIRLCAKDEKEAAKKHISAENAYMARVSEWYGETGDVTIRSTWFPLAGSSYAAKQHIDTLRFTAAMLANEMADVDESTDLPGVFECDGSCQACKRYNRTCEYMDLCDTDPVAWPTIINAFYTQSLEPITPAEEEETHDS